MPNAYVGGFFSARDAADNGGADTAFLSSVGISSSGLPLIDAIRRAEYDAFQNTVTKFGIHRLYYGWGDSVWTDSTLTTTMSQGRIPVLSLYPQIKTWSGCAADASYITSLVGGLKALTGEVWVIFHHEPNVAEGTHAPPPIPETQANTHDFRQVYKNLRDEITSQSATNIKLLSCILGSQYDSGKGDYYFPGAPYESWTGVLDFLGVDLYNWYAAPAANISNQWRELTTLINSIKNYSWGSGGKSLPIVICETGCMSELARNGFTSSCGMQTATPPPGGAAKGTWFLNGLASFKTLTQTKFAGFMYFQGGNNKFYNAVLDNPALLSTRCGTVSTVFATAQSLTDWRSFTADSFWTPAGTPPTPTLSALTITPGSVVAGGTANGTVTLTAPAPTGGISVDLESDSPFVHTPSSVTIPSGSSSAGFAVTTDTQTVGPGNATISALLGTSLLKFNLGISVPSPVPSGAHGSGPTLGQYRVVIASIGGFELEEVPAKNLIYSYVLNSPGSVYFQLETLDSKTNPLLLACGAREIHVYKEQQLVWGGYLWTSRADESHTQFGGEGYFSMLRRRLITDDLVFTATDQFEIVRQLLAYTQGKAYGNLSIIPDTSTSGIVRDRTYNGYEVKNLGDAITDLASVIDGFDFEITPDRLFKMYYPSKGLATDITFELGKNISGISQEIDASKVATDWWSVGSGSGPTTLLSEASDAAALLEFGLMQDTSAYVDVTEQDTLDGHAAEDLRLAKQPRDDPQVAAFTDDPPYGSFSVGDQVRLKADYGYMQIDAPYRIITLTVAVSDEGVESTSLTFDPVLV